MRVRSLDRTVGCWVADARWLYHVHDLPENKERKAFFKGIGLLRKGEHPKVAIAAVYRFIAEYSEQQSALKWIDIVKPPQ